MEKGESVRPGKRRQDENVRRRERVKQRHQEGEEWE